MTRNKVRPGKGPGPFESTRDDQDLDKLVEALLKLKKAGKEPLVIHLEQLATNAVVSGRYDTATERL